MKPITEKDALVLRDKLYKLAYKYGVEDIAAEVLDDPKFIKWTGSSRPEIHHYGDHGLIMHTSEVVGLCIANNDIMDYGINKKDLFLAGLFHDIGKTRDYEQVGGAWGAAQHKYEVHHIARSAIIWSTAAEKHGYPESEVLHAILAHHQLKEWGSPVQPQTKLAWMLHLCDNISARLDDARSV